MRFSESYLETDAAFDSFPFRRVAVLFLMLSWTVFSMKQIVATVMLCGVFFRGAVDLVMYVFLVAVNKTILIHYAKEIVLLQLAFVIIHLTLVRHARPLRT